MNSSFLNKIYGWSFLIILVAGLTWGLMKIPSDLRSMQIKAFGIQPEAQDMAKYLLKYSSMIHGIDSLEKYASKTLTFRNYWEPAPGAAFRPWKENGQLVSFNMENRPGYFQTATFLDGPNQGDVWGTENKTSFKISSFTGEKKYEEDPNLQLWLPTFHFLFEAGFKLLDAEMISYDNVDTLADGQTYHKVFVTWESVDPIMGADQMICYINTETLVFEKLHYTCRESDFGFFTATIHYLDFERNYGILEAQKSIITYGDPHNSLTGDTVVLHTIEMVEPAKYDLK